MYTKTIFISFLPDFVKTTKWGRKFSLAFFCFLPVLICTAGESML